MKFIQASDFHLDSPQHRLPPDVARWRREELLAAFTEVTDRCDAERADLLLLPGDLFEAEHVRRETILAVKERLSGVRAKVMIAPGNHDPAGPGSLWQGSFPAQVHIFSGPWEALEVQGLTIHGYGFEAPALSENPFSQKRLPPGQHLVVAHADLGSGRSAYAPVTAADIRELGALWVALGHIHRHMPFPGGAYAGSPEPLGFDELGEHGYLVGEIGEGGAKVSFVSRARRTYHDLSFAYAGQTPEELAARICEMIGAACSPDDFVRVKLEGARRQGRPLPLELVASAVAESYPLAVVEDATRPAEEAGDLPEGLRRRLSQYFDSAQASAGDEERQVLQAAFAYARAALEGRDLFAD